MVSTWEGDIYDYYWRSLNEQNMPKPSIAQAFADYFDRTTYGAHSGSHIEVFDHGHWLKSSEYRRTYGRWPPPSRMHRLAPDVGSTEPIIPRTALSTRLRNLVYVIAYLTVACATAHESSRPVASGAVPPSVEHQPPAPIEPEPAPPTAATARPPSETLGPGLGAPAAELETSEPDSLSELGAAAFGGDAQKVDALLARGADVNQRERDGATALALALSNYHEEPKCCEHAEQRRLTHMAQRAQRKLRIARTLIEHGADVTLADRLDLTPLHHAVMAYGPEQEVIAIMELLIAHGADVNRRAQPYQRSPLEWAIGKSPERVACLLRHGADPSMITHEGKTLLQVAEARGDAHIVEQIRAALAERPRK